MEYFDDEPCASGVERELVKELAKQAIDMCHVLVPEVKSVPVTLYHLNVCYPSFTDLQHFPWFEILS